MRSVLFASAALTTLTAAAGCCAGEYVMVVESNGAPINDGYPVKLDIVISKSKDTSDLLEKADVVRWFEGARDDFASRPISLTVPGEKNYRRTITLKVGTDTDYGAGAPTSSTADIVRTIPEELDAIYVFAHYRGADPAGRKRRISRDTFMCLKGQLEVELGKNQIRDVRLAPLP
jgi:hypothetical protein